MATIQNERDVLLQAATERLLPITLPSNVVLSIDQVIDAGVLARVDFVDAETQVVNLGELAYADTIVANQVIAGTFTGLSFQTTSSTANNRILIDSITNDIRVWVGGVQGVKIGGSAGNAFISIDKGPGLTPGMIVDVTAGAAGIWARTSSNSNSARAVYATSSAGASAIDAENSGSGVAIGARATSSSSSTNHAIRGQHSQSGASGLVGTSIGYAFYDEGGGYGPFTGAHDGMVPNGFEGDPGDILIDDEVVRTRGVSDVIMTAKLCSEVGEQGAIGVLVSIAGPVSSVKQAALITGMDPETGLPYMSGEWVDYGDTHQAVKINAVGEGLINVCGRGGDLAKGDLIICSDLPGKGQRQTDDIIRANTVAKARVAVTFDYPDQVKLVPCIYLCG